MTNQRKIVIVKWGAFAAFIFCILASFFYGSKVISLDEGAKKAQAIALLTIYLTMAVVNFNSWRRALRLEKDRRQ